MDLEQDMKIIQKSLMQWLLIIEALLMDLRLIIVKQIPTLEVLKMDKGMAMEHKPKARISIQPTFTKMKYMDIQFRRPKVV